MTKRRGNFGDALVPLYEALLTRAYKGIYFRRQEDCAGCIVGFSKKVLTEKEKEGKMSVSKLKKNFHANA